MFYSKLQKNSNTNFVQILTISYIFNTGMLDEASLRSRFSQIIFKLPYLSYPRHANFPQSSKLLLICFDLFPMYPYHTISIPTFLPR